MTRFVLARITDPPSPASKTAAGGRLCQAQEFRLNGHGASTGEAPVGPLVNAEPVPHHSNERSVRQLPAI